MTDASEGSVNSWGSLDVFDSFTMISQQLEQFRVKSARIVTPPGYEPQEVWIIWESLSSPMLRVHLLSRGLLTRQKKFMLISLFREKEWKHMTYTMSNDCKLGAFVSESIELGHERDVIEVESIKFHQPMFNIVLEKDEQHGAIIITGPHSHFKFSPESNRKLLYFARPTKEQLATKNRLERLFVICIYDFAAKGITVITDENLCEKPINAIEWTPDCRGVVLHRETDLVWHRFGEQYANIIYSNCPAPLKITFSPDDSRLAVFMPASYQSDKSIFLFHWPFVKAAVQFKHDVISLGAHRVWSVPDRPWANNGKSLVFNANWQHSVISYAYTIESRELLKFTFPKPAIVVDVQNNEMLFETVSANSHTRLWISSVSCVTTIDNEFIASLLAQQQHENSALYNFDIKSINFDNNAYTGVLYMVPDSEVSQVKMPLVVVPYSGEKPNFTFVSLDTVLSTLVTCGFCVLIVNHRDPFSAEPDGFPLNFDMNTTDDVHDAVLATLEKYKSRLDPDSVCLYAADYGSFIAGTMLTKYPTFYKAAALYRPLLKYPDTEGLDDELKEYLGSYEAISNVEKIKTPILIVSDTKENTMYREFENTLLTCGVTCFEEYLDEDEELNDFIAKVTHFYKDPLGELGEELPAGEIEEENK